MKDNEEAESGDDIEKSQSLHSNQVYSDGFYEIYHFFQKRTRSQSLHYNQVYSDRSKSICPTSYFQYSQSQSLHSNQVYSDGYTYIGANIMDSVMSQSLHSNQVYSDSA